MTKIKGSVKVQATENSHYYLATADLVDVISHFYHLEHPPGTPSVTQQLAPNLEIFLAFSFGTPVEVYFPQATTNPLYVTRSAIIGPLRQLLHYKLNPGADVMLVNFKFNGFHRLFRNGMTELSNTDKSNADCVICGPIILESWWQELAGLSCIKQRIKRFSELAIVALGASDDIEKGIISNHGFFYDSKTDPAKAFAEHHGVSQRAIQLRFQNTVGYSVKELLRYLRFKAVVMTLMDVQGNKPDMMELVESHNYHDQSHLIKDFKYFVGMPPLKFFKEIRSGSICMNADTYPKP